MAKSIKVLYVHHGSGNGGAPNSLLRLLQNFDMNILNVIVACDSLKPSAKIFFEKYGFYSIELPIALFSHVASWWPLYSLRGLTKTLEWILLKQPRTLYSLRKILQRTQPDIVHLNSLTLAPLLPMIRRYRVPVVLHVREPVAAGNLGFRRQWLQNFARNYADHVIYICKDNRDRLTGVMNNASVIYDPIPFDRFDKEIDGKIIRNELMIPDNASVLFFPGGSSFEIKGVFPFLEALAIVRKQKKNIVAILPGIDGISSKIRNKEHRLIDKTIMCLGLEEAVVRVPFSNEVENYYAASDIIMAPFVKAHFSLAVIEAGAMGKPVIGSRIGGIEEVLIDGKNGFLVDPFDSKELAKKIIELIENNCLATIMGQEGYRQSRKLCDAKQYARRISNLYINICGDRYKRDANVAQIEIANS